VHVLPQLRRLAEQFRRELVVIGVHDGKYPNERRTPHIAHAARRLDVEHPIVNDRMYRIWRAYGVNAWPTLALIDPGGNYLGKKPGESTAARWAAILQPLIAEYDAQGLLDRAPLALERVPTDEPRRPLRYPDKLLADDQRRLFIADSGHHRIVVAALDGERVQTIKIIGSGNAGSQDGAIQAATFNHPRGLALLDETLYVADTENHLLRAVDLGSDEVRTVAGTGERGIRPPAHGPGRQVALASPWDLAPHAGKLAIAMAGMHQIWLFDPAQGMVELLAGTGRELLEDGSLWEAALAQPSGLSSDGDALFFVDSEAQAIRQLNLGRAANITTIVGTGLFDYGDKDGLGDEVVLQHPQAVAAHGGRLYVADSYNHKIKIVEPQTRRCETWLGARRIPGHVDGSALAAAFYEPGGLSIANNTLYIADTNNHVIRAADLSTGVVRTLEIDGLEPC
jgi:hypothetical protein